MRFTQWNTNVIIKPDAECRLRIYFCHMSFCNLNLNLKVNKIQNVSALWHQYKTPQNQRLIFLSHEVSPGLDTMSWYNEWHVEKQLSVFSLPHFEYERDLMATAANSTIKRVILNGTQYYLSCRFKCFAHLFPLNISSCLKYSFNFLFKFFTSLFAVAIFLPPF